MIVARYNAMPNPTQERMLLSNLPRIGGLSDLVGWILTVEAGFAENTPGAIRDFFEVIESELRRFGLSEEELRGTGVVEATSRFLAQRYLAHKQAEPGVADRKLFESAIGDLYPTNEEAREHLVTRLPLSEGLASVAIGAGMLMGSIDELSLEAAGDVIHKEMTRQGLSAEQIFGPSFVKSVQRDLKRP